MREDASSRGEWRWFFFLRLPLAVVSVALVVEAVAAALGGVTLHRHNVDDLANAVTQDMRPYVAVLLGDSVTHNVSHKWRIGAEGEVADLTTHARAGMPSALFLLERYLSSGHRPKHVVLAASRGLYIDPMERATFKYYVGSVFKLPYERQFLGRYYGDYLDKGWRPAALSITTTVGEPLFSLLRRPGNSIWTAPQVPEQSPALETYPASASMDSNQASQDGSRVGANRISPEVRAILVEMGRLSQEYGFALHIVWPPVEPRLYHSMVESGAVGSINSQLKMLFASQHIMVSIDDTRAGQVYPYFDQDLIHIKGLGWEQTYANQLTAYIHSFEAETPTTRSQEGTT